MNIKKGRSRTGRVCYQRGPSSFTRINALNFSISQRTDYSFPLQIFFDLARQINKTAPAKKQKSHKRSKCWCQILWWPELWWSELSNLVMITADKSCEAHSLKILWTSQLWKLVMIRASCHSQWILHSSERLATRNIWTIMNWSY